MNKEEHDLVEKLKKMDEERGLHLIQKVLAHYSVGSTKTYPDGSVKHPFERPFAIIQAWHEKRDSGEPDIIRFDVLAVPNPEAYSEGVYQGGAVDLADFGYCQRCKIDLVGSKHSFCPICGEEVYLT